MGWLLTWNRSLPPTYSNMSLLQSMEWRYSDLCLVESICTHLPNPYKCVQCCWVKVISFKCTQYQNGLHNTICQCCLHACYCVIVTNHVIVLEANSISVPAWIPSFLADSSWNLAGQPVAGKSSVFGGSWRLVWPREMWQLSGGTCHTKYPYMVSGYV